MGSGNISSPSITEAGIQVLRCHQHSRCLGLKYSFHTHSSFLLQPDFFCVSEISADTSWDLHCRASAIKVLLTLSQIWFQLSRGGILINLTWPSAYLTLSIIAGKSGYCYCTSVSLFSIPAHSYGQGWGYYLLS